MPGHRRNPRLRHWLWVGLGLFCCALVALSGIVQAGHTHTAGPAVQSDCALCQTAHLVIHQSVPQSLPHVLVSAIAIVAALQPICRYHCTTFSLFTRPPPARTAHS
jgi:hypothetical protein